MAPPIKLQRTLDAIKRIGLSESRKQPVMVIFEDLHWTDAQTQALLDVLPDSILLASCCWSTTSGTIETSGRIRAPTRDSGCRRWMPRTVGRCWQAC